MSPPPKLLDAIPLFASMDDDERTALAAIMDEVSFKVGQTIYRAADIGGTLYISALRGLAQPSFCGSVTFVCAIPFSHELCRRAGSCLASSDAV